MDASPDDPGPPAHEAPTRSPLGAVPARPAGRGLWTAGALVAAVLILAVAKPWTQGASSPRTGLPHRSVVPASSGPPATPDLSPQGLAADVCLGTGAWRVATIETWRLVIAGQIVTQRVRVWHAVDPARAANGPADARVPIVGVAGMEVDALGWCAPSIGDGRPIGSVDVTVWRLANPSRRDGAPEPQVVAVRRVAPPGETSLAALYREVTDCVSGFGCSGRGVPLLASSWSPGRYVFQYAERGSSATWWFGADVQVLPAPTGEPAVVP